MQKDERILQIVQNISWLPQPNEVRTVLSSQLPPGEMIATALVLAFDRDCLLQTNLAARGWDMVGGHIEPQDKPLSLLMGYLTANFLAVYRLGQSPALQ